MFRLKLKVLARIGFLVVGVGLLVGSVVSLYFDWHFGR
jgi:hypothetical protein